MWKNRLGYASLMIVLAVLLFFSGKSFLLTVLLLLLILLPIFRGLIRKDGKQIELQLKKEDMLVAVIHAEENFLVADRLQLELEIKNEMFDRTEYLQFLLPIKGKEQIYRLPIENNLCGQVRFRCTHAWVTDLLGLFRVPVKSGQILYTVIYPPKIKVQMERIAGTVGSSQTDGLLQNRKGNDPSEMFELRDYVPGDDIRSIHWKLTSKTDDLIIRQASDPSHHTLLLLPDYGLNQLKRPDGEMEMNTIIGTGVETARAILKKGRGFCMAIPTRNGLQIHEVQNEKEFSRLLPQWFSIPVQAVSGNGLEYFQMQHLEQYFNRVVILSSGVYDQGLRGMDQKLGITVIQAVAGKEVSYTALKQNGVLIEIPAREKQKETYRILC
jgi:hypothetical protein